MTDEDGMTPDERVWYRRQLERAKAYRAMIAARRAGKATPMALCADGTKVLIMPDDPGYTAAAYRALKIFDEDVRLAGYAARLAQFESEGK